MKKNNLHITKKVLTMVLPLTLVITGCSSKTGNKNNDDSQQKNKIVETLPEEEAISIDPIVPEMPSENYNNEDQVIDYFNNMEQNLDQVFTKENFKQAKEQFKESVFSSLVTSVEFFCNRQDIGGYYFKDLTEPTKQKILSIIENIDKKITERYPDYKNYLKEKWNIGYEAYQNLFSNVKEKVKNALGEEKYNKMIETKDKIKTKTKEKLNEWKDKTKKWYNEKREEYK